VGSLLNDAPGGPIEDRVLAAAREAAEQCEKHRLACDRVTGVDGRLALARQAEGAATAEADRIDREAAAVADAIARAEADLARVREDIRAAAGTDNPAGESARLSVEVERLDRELDAAKQVEGEAKNRLDLTRTREELCTREAVGAAAEEKDAAEAASRALLLTGFPSPAAARGAWRAPERLAHLRDLLQKHDTQVLALGSRITELERELQGRRVSAEEAGRAEEEHDSCRERKEAAGIQVALLGQQIEAMATRLELAGRLREELTVQRRRRDVYHALALDLRSDRFQAFLLEETFAALVHDASAQFVRLTGERYGLDFVDDCIRVIDNDNAGERRGVETLSGGETFLASLALALALSGQVQRAVGAVRLDSLFIDEGFGTLDAETLRTASDGIHSLQAGGRMVGVITHLPALQDEFDQKVSVTKEGGVSSVRVEPA
jgi:exonuclease SbcC